MVHSNNEEAKNQNIIAALSFSILFSWGDDEGRL
jgi:hypothetical protein